MDLLTLWRPCQRNSLLLRLQDELLGHHGILPCRMWRTLWRTFPQSGVLADRRLWHGMWEMKKWKLRVFWWKVPQQIQKKMLIKVCYSVLQKSTGCFSKSSSKFKLNNSFHIAYIIFVSYSLERAEFRLSDEYCLKVVWLILVELW